MQTKRAVRPSTTSTSSSLRVKSGCTEGCTVSRALQVSSSARRAGTGEPPQHMAVQGRRQPLTPPGCNPATSVAVGEHTPYTVWVEPRCVAFRALSLCRAGGTNVCKVPMPRAGALMAAGTSFLSAQQYRCQQQGGMRGCPVLPIGQEITAGLSPWGWGNSA